MAELPPVPNLDLDIDTDSFNEPTASRTRPAEPLAPKVSAQPAVAARPAAQSVPREIPNEPIVPPTPPMAEILNDSVSEVLQQSTDQMLRLARLEEGIHHAKQAVNEAREETLSGLIELRSFTEQLLKTQPAPVVQPDPALAHRLEHVEEQANTVTGRVSTLTILVAVNMLLGIGALVLIWMVLQKEPPAAPPPPAPVVTAPPAPLASPISEEAKRASEDGRTKKSRRR